MPLAEIKTAGVIIAVSTASDEVNASIRSDVHSNDCLSLRPNAAGLKAQVCAMLRPIPHKCLTKQTIH